MPTSWDTGASGPANRLMLVDEPATEFDPATGKDAPNPNGIRRVRRMDPLEILHRKGQISTAGFNTAEKLRDAFEATQRSPGWPDNDRVQSSPKPDHAVTIQIDRLSRFAQIMGAVPRADKSIISACVLDRASPQKAGGIEHLRSALDRLASAMERLPRY